MIQSIKKVGEENARLYNSFSCWMEIFYILHFQQLNELYNLAFSSPTFFIDCIIFKKRITSNYLICYNNFIQIKGENLC